MSLKVPPSNSLDIESEENKKSSVISTSGTKSLAASLKKLYEVMEQTS